MLSAEMMSSYTQWPGPNPTTILRSDSMGSISRSDSLRYMEQTCLMMEKRQLFLRSYQFSRKRGLGERIRRAFTRAKRVIWLRLRMAARLRKLVCSRLSGFRQRFCSRRRTRVFLGGWGGYRSQGGRNRGSSSSSCFC
ncbi:hypothetical protein MLD38_027453 [Melastoma candidum]|uniref:Uncharacterized protein n=1 Tax=Melastoma candidum TaxID=119954 RepID=A0ACB9P363_9MYRT|nr:hypothetical protein MLD38_027453 [Melastoma candidum]